MPEYYFEVDRRVFIWQRDKYIIEAETPEKARELMDIEVTSPSYDHDKGYNSTETLDDTSTAMELVDNGDYSTIELRDDQGNVIWQNGTPNS